MNTPAYSALEVPVPLPAREKVEKSVPTTMSDPPITAICRARLTEKRATTKMKVIGLINHHGSDPAPPGLAKNAKFGPPPELNNPISRSSPRGEVMSSKLHGRVRSTGRKIKAARLASLALSTF